MARARRGGTKRRPSKPLPVWSPPTPPLPPEPYQSDGVGRLLGILFLIIIVPFGLSGLLPRSSTGALSPVSSGTSTYYGSSTATLSGATYSTAALPSDGQTTLYSTPSTPSFESPPVAEGLAVSEHHSNRQAADRGIDLKQQRSGFASHSA